VLTRLEISHLLGPWLLTHRQPSRRPVPGGVGECREQAVSIGPAQPVWARGVGPVAADGRPDDHWTREDAALEPTPELVYEPLS
jgi:hypothetical protein